MTLLYRVLDIFFFTLHVGLILFNLFGWIERRTRKWNILTLGLTAFSWFGLGYFYGFGYCFLTDWHWSVREKLGYVNRFSSYVQFLLNSLFGNSMESRTVDALTATLFFTALLMSIITNIRDLRHPYSK